MRIIQFMLQQVFPINFDWIEQIWSAFRAIYYCYCRSCGRYFTIRIGSCSHSRSTDKFLSQYYFYLIASEWVKKWRRQFQREPSTRSIYGLCTVYGIRAMGKINKRALVSGDVRTARSISRTSAQERIAMLPASASHEQRNLWPQILSVLITAKSHQVRQLNYVVS